MEQMIQRYQDEQWARYDAQQQALADARAALAREVADVRARQVAAKGAARRHEAELAMEERERLQEEVERVAALEADARSAAAAGELRRKLDLRAKVPPRLPSSFLCMHACTGLPEAHLPLGKAVVQPAVNANPMNAGQWLPEELLSGWEGEMQLGGYLEHCDHGLGQDGMLQRAAGRRAVRHVDCCLRGHVDLPGRTLLSLPPHRGRTALASCKPCPAYTFSADPLVPIGRFGAATGALCCTCQRLHLCADCVQCRAEAARGRGEAARGEAGWGAGVGVPGAGEASKRIRPADVLWQAQGAVVLLACRQGHFCGGFILLSAVGAGLAGGHATTEQRGAAQQS